MNHFYGYEIDEDLVTKAKNKLSKKIIIKNKNVEYLYCVSKYPTALTEIDKIIENNGVKIMGESNILNKLPVSASSLYAKNVFNFVDNLFDKKNKKININLEDEIIEKTLIK